MPHTCQLLRAELRPYEEGNAETCRFTVSPQTYQECAADAGEPDRPGLHLPQRGGVTRAVPDGPAQERAQGQVQERRYAGLDLSKTRDDAKGHDFADSGDDRAQRAEVVKHPFKVAQRPERERIG